MSKDIEERLNGEIREERFAPQMDEATDSDKHCSITTSVGLGEGAFDLQRTEPSADGPSGKSLRLA